MFCKLQALLLFIKEFVIMKEILVQAVADNVQVISTTVVMAVIRFIELKWRKSKWKSKLDDIKRANGITD